MNIKISNNLKYCFFSGIIFGLVIHLYMFTNKLPNWDDLSAYHSAGATLSSGRWLLDFLNGFSSIWSLPWVNGIWGIIYLSFTSCFIVYILKLKSVLLTILVSLTVVSFPSVTSIYTYMFTADLFFASILLNCVGVFFIREYKYGYLYAAITFSLGLGIYQSFICFAIGLLVISFIFDIFEQKELPQIIETGLKSLVALVLGFVIYFLILKTLLFIEGSGLTSYQGINNMGIISIGMLPRLVLKAFGKVVLFFLISPEGFYRNPIIWSMNILACFSGLFLYIQTIRDIQLYKSKEKFAVLLILTAILPFALGFIYIMAPNSFTHLIMLFQYCLVYITLIRLLDLYMDKKNLVFKNIFVKPICGLALLSMIIINYNNFLIANQSYFLMHLTYERMYAFYTKMSMRIEEINNSESMQIAFLGACDSNIVFRDIKLEEALKGMIGVTAPEDFLKESTRTNFLRTYIGMPFTQPNSTTLNEISSNDEFKAMPAYPSPGSIKMINDICVVKLSE